jgi:acyl-CoA thioesterase
MAPSPGATATNAPSMTDSPDPQRLAERVRDAMFGKDFAAQALGMKVVAIGPGTAGVSMTVRPDMANGFGICHGGLVATLADTAFAYACNSWNIQTVAAGFDVQLLAAGKIGDSLLAQAGVVSQGRRTGVYDVNVHNQDQVLIAVFRGRSHRLKGPLVEA